MPRLTKEQRLEQARKLADQAKANLRSAAAAMAAETRKDNRKTDTRRKILAGALLFQWASQNPAVSAKLKAFIDGLEGRDKEAFADWPVPAPPTKASAPQAPASIAKPAAPDQGEVAPPSQSAPAPAQGAFGGTPMPPQPSTAPAPTGAPSAQPIKATTT